MMNIKLKQFSQQIYKIVWIMQIPSLFALYLPRKKQAFTVYFC